MTGRVRQPKPPVFRVGDLDQRLLRMAAPRGDDRRGEHLDGVVVVRHGRIVRAAYGLQLVLHLLDLPLQVEELRVGLQFGVILDGDMEPAEQRRELAAFADLLALRGRGRARTQVGDARQELVLVDHVGLDRGHQIRDQVVALLQDHADAAPALPDTVASGDQAVVRDDAPYDQQHGDCSHDDNKDCSGRHNVYLLSGSVFSGLSRNFRVSAASILLLRYSGFRPGP